MLEGPSESLERSVDWQLRDYDRTDVQNPVDQSATLVCALQSGCKARSRDTWPANFPDSHVENAEGVAELVCIKAFMCTRRYVANIYRPGHHSGQPVSRNQARTSETDRLKLDLQLYHHSNLGQLFEASA